MTARRLLALAARCLSLALLAAAAVSCVPASGREAGADLNTCETDADCAWVAPGCDPSNPGCTYRMTCAPDFSACIDEAQTPYSLVLRVLRPDTGVSSEHRLAAGEVRAGDPTTLHAPQLLVVRGMVDDEREGGTPEPVAARIAFTRQSALAGLPPEPIYAESGTGDDDLIREGDRLSNFQTRLVPGTYDVEVEPMVGTSAEGPEQDYYPLRSVVSIEGPNAGDVFFHGEQLRYLSESRYIEGVVSDAARQPLGGVRVFAHEPETGRRISNIALTECEEGQPDACGRFRLAVPPETSAFLLRIEGGQTSPLLPEIDRGGYDFVQLDRNQDGIVTAAEFGDVRFPALQQPIIMEVLVEGESGAGARGPLRGAVMIFRTDEIGEDTAQGGAFEARATTDTDGQTVGEDQMGLPGGTGIRLFPAQYAVEVTPPADSGYAAAVLEMTVAPEDEGGARQTATLRVGPRQSLTGLVTVVDGTAAPQVRVEAVGREGASFAAVTDPAGRFVVEVDPGLYDLTFVPPEQSLLPWTFLFRVSAFSAVDVPVSLGYGAPVRGEIVLEDSGEAVAGAVVEAFVERSSADGPSLLRIGRATAGDDGRFLLLLAPTIEQ
jgi:hypothetical protein